MTQSPDHRFEIVVSIINFRTAELTLQCLQSVLDDLAGIDGHVVIVDNRSDDGSAEIIADAIAALPAPAPVTLVRSATNSGFSGGHNQGMAARPAEFYLILNSDALLRPGFLRAILDGARAEPGAGLFAPRIDYDDGSQQISCFRFPGPASELMRGAQTGVVTRLLGRREIPLKMPPAPDQIEWASFACILLRGDDGRCARADGRGLFPLFRGYRILPARPPRGLAGRLPAAGAGRAFPGRQRSGQEPCQGTQAPACLLLCLAHPLSLSGAWLGGADGGQSRLVPGRGIAQVRRLAGKPVPASNRAEARDIWINALTPLGDRRAVGG